MKQLIVLTKFQNVIECEGYRMYERVKERTVTFINKENDYLA